MLKKQKNSEQFMNPMRDVPVFLAIRQALTLMIPLFMAGSFAVLINNLPIAAFQNAMENLFGDNWKNFGAYLYQGTFAIMSVGVLIAVSYNFAANDKMSRLQNINPFLCSLISLTCFFTLLYAPDQTLSLRWFGPLGLFVAIVTALVSVKVFQLLYRVNALHFNVYSDAADSTVNQAMSSLFPALITIVLFVAIRMLLDLLGIQDIHATLEEGLRQLFIRMPVTIWTALLFVMSTHFFWFMGMHGNNILEPVVQNSFGPALLVNQNLVAQGLPPSEVFTKQFFDVFVYLGGSGATLCLLVALFIGARRSNARQIAAISALPSVINVNEMLMYGLPLIFNMYFIIPFIGVPLLLTLTSYAAMSLGLVPLTVESVEWTTPIFLGGYMATNSVAGIALQAFNLTLGVMAYLPFVRMHERRLARDNERTLKSLQQETLTFNLRHSKEFLNRRDAEGNLARILARDMEQDLSEKKMRLEYQPLVNNEGRVEAVEALLRWTHETYGDIASPMVIQLAEESGLIHEFGLWIFQESIDALKVMRAAGLDIVISVNITPVQLDWPEFAPRLEKMLNQSGLPPDKVEIEITEQVALGGLDRLKQIHRLRSIGVRMAMDDFGMGHSSLMYLKEFDLNTIKLDGGLVREVLTNQNCREIINSIVHLSRSMNLQTVAEFVETEQQRDALQELGCNLYQGYYYSRSLPLDRLVEYALAQNASHPAHHA